MIFLIVAVVIFLVGFVRFASARPRTDARDIGITIIVISALFFIFGSLIPTSVAYVNSSDDHAKIQQYRQNQHIYQTKATQLISEVRGYLAVQYPNFEKSVIDKIARDPALLFTVFPQLRTADTLKSLTDQIIALQSQVYDQEIAISQSEKNIRFRTHNPYFLPILPTS